MAFVLALRLWLKWEGPFFGDEWALGRGVIGDTAQWVLDIGNLFQAIGTAVVAALTIAWAAVFVFRSDGPRGVAFVLLAALGVVFNAGLKELSGPTPLMWKRAAGAGLNYPSGHTVYAVVVFGALAWIAWHHRRYAIVAALVFLIVMMGPFRVLLGAHFVSDVVAAYLVGIGWLVPAAIATGYWRGRLPTRHDAG